MSRIFLPLLLRAPRFVYLDDDCLYHRHETCQTDKVSATTPELCGGLEATGVIKVESSKDWEFQDMSLIENNLLHLVHGAVGKLPSPTKSGGNNNDTENTADVAHVTES